MKTHRVHLSSSLCDVYGWIKGKQRQPYTCIFFVVRLGVEEFVIWRSWLRTGVGRRFIRYLAVAKA